MVTDVLSPFIFIIVIIIVVQIMSTLLMSMHGLKNYLTTHHTHDASFLFSVSKLRKPSVSAF